MKKILAAIILTIAINHLSFSQDFKREFLGDDFLHYKGAFFTLDENITSSLIYAFYSSLSSCKQWSTASVIYRDPKHNFITVKDSLSNKIFRVEDIITVNGDPFPEESYIYDPIFVLKNIKNNEVIYYKYDKSYEHTFPFLVLNIKFDIKRLKSKIRRTVDDFTNEITICSPLREGDHIAPMILFKFINGNITHYALSLTTYGSTINFDKTKIIILFEDKSRINKEVKISIGEDDIGYRYSAVVPLTKEDLELLTTTRVDKFRLYIYDEAIHYGQAKMFIYYARLILESE